jgi:CRISPR-associated protein Cas1
MLEQRSPRSVEELLGIEGSIANEYFRAWSGIELKWKALAKRPIPSDWRVYSSRSALRDQLRVNRGATHPVNAMLNYAYGVLMARTQVQLIAEGYDPTIGILHGRESERGSYPAFALDRMEPMRPAVDRAVLQLVETTTFDGADFSIQPDGVCRLNPELARRLVKLAVSEISKSKRTLAAS